MLLSSSDLSDLRIPSSNVSVDSGGPIASANATGYTPYLLNVSTLPLPSPLLNGTGGATLPQLAQAPLGAISVIELAYVQTSFGKTNNLSFLSGEYNSTLAVKAYTRLGCAGPCPRTPILWGSPVTIAKFGRLNVTGDAIAAASDLVAVAAAFGTKTTVWFSGNYGANGTWVNLTAPSGLIVGGSPRLALFPCGLEVTTIASAALYATTFRFACHYTPNSPLSSGGGTPGVARPTVRSVTPDYGLGGGSLIVNITGTNLANSPTVYFGTATAGITFESSTKLEASVPTGTGVVHVTVNSGGLTSNATCADLFTYSSYTGLPTISSVVPSEGPAGTLETITGSGFTPGAFGALDFGGVPSTDVVTIAPTQVKATAPSNNGTVYVTATVSGKTSLQTCGGEFTYNPGTPPPNSVALPPAIAAYPAWITGGTVPVAGILASNVSNSEVVFYNSSNWGSSYNGSRVEPINNSLGSSVFGAIGGTRLVVATGQSGQIAFAAEGVQLFGMFTSRVQGRTAIETVASTNAGQSWTGPYLTSSPQGAIMDPEAATSPAGYAYATWRDNSGGAWEVDSAIFAFDGQTLQQQAAIPGSGGSLGVSAGPPTLAVDNFQRPLYVWSAWNSSAADFELRYTGGYLTPTVSTQQLRSAWNETVPDEFQPMSLATLGFFKANVNGSLVSLQMAIGSSGSQRLCWSWTNFSRYVYPNVTAGDPAPYVSAPGSPVTGCPNIPSPGTAASKVAALEGPFAADVYLYVYSDWISEALGYGTLPPPNWQGSPVDSPVTVVVTPPGGTRGSPYLLAPSNSTDDTQGDIATVNPVTINPNTLWLNATDHFASKFQTTQFKQSLPNGGSEDCGGTQTTDQIHSVVANLSVLPQGAPKVAGTFTNPYRVPNIWVSNLSAGENGTWYENVSLGFQEWFTSQNTCTHTSSSGPVSISPTWPSNSVLHLKGNFTTGLGFDPWTPTLPLIVQSFPDPANSSLAENSLHWNNTIWANATTWNNESYCGGGCTPYANESRNLSFQTPENLAFKPQPNNNQYYQAFAVIRSHPGGYSNAWTSVLNSAEVSVASNPEVGTASCSYYQTANPIEIALPTPAVTHITDTSATVTWFSNENGSGWLDYNDTWEATFSETATELGSGNHTYPYAYQVELRGLRSWGVYEATLGVGAFAGCLEYLNSTHILFQTVTQAALSEYDYPYDSISKQGGGAAIEWQEPAGFDAISEYVNGNLTYFPTSNTSDVVTVPLPTIWFVEDDGPLGTTMGVNVTGLTVNTVYNATLFLNYTLRPPSGYGMRPHLYVGSSPFVFWYERDTSGDGLTDWEKLRGWEVTAQDAWGNWQYRWVVANPSLYATNGLTSDYQEKLYGLDPATVDSAGSHMLDVWNLTFDLGPKTSTLKVPAGANFQYESEAGNASTDYTWTAACQYYVAPGASCALGAINTGAWFNISAADSWAWASRVLWSRSALTTFINMSGVRNASWLRATLGNNTSDWTLTVWGKLSWGANPLATSTPRDGTADGARANPLYDEDLLISSASASLTACPKAPRGGAYGWAALFYLNWSTTSGPHELPANGNYSKAALDRSTDGTSNCGSFSGYQVPIPINSTSQNQSLQVRVLLNESSSPSSTLLKAQKISGSSTVISVSYDAFAGHPESYSYTGSNGTASFTLSTVPAGVKNNTLLWLPTDNSTLNNLPWGLKRYTGEQAFDLVVVNLQSPSAISTDAVPYAQNSSDHYYATFTPGLNNLLIPRGQFLYSVLGQAILLGKNTAWLNASARPPLLNATENSTISYGSSNPLLNLACYWQNRAINNTSGSLAPICTHNSTNGLTSEAGTPLGNSLGIVTVAATSASGVNTGGVPGNPSLEPSGDTGAALQAVLTLNVTAKAGLDLLLAALLDNTTGGVNGTFLPVTSQVPALGLNSVVTGELANVTYASSGLFGIPWGITPPPPPQPPCNSGWCWGSNLVSGILTIGSEVLSYVWSRAVAVGQFIDDHLPTWLKNFGAEVAQRSAAGLTAFGDDLASTLAEALTFVKAIVNPLLTAIFSPIQGTLAAYVESMWIAYRVASADVNASGTVSQSDAATLLNAAFGVPILIALGVASTVLIIFAVVDGLSLGSDFVMGLVIGLLVSFALTAIASVAVLPTALLIGGSAVQGGWLLYNLTTGTGHFTPMLSTTCPAWGVLLSAFIGAAAFYTVGHGILASIKLFQGMARTASGVEWQVVFPVLEVVIGLVALLLELYGSVAGANSALAILGIILAGGGAFFAYMTILRYGSEMPASTRNEALLGLALDGAAVGAAIAKGGLGC